MPRGQSPGPYVLSTPTNIVVNSAVGVPGESRTFEARLRLVNQAPVAGKTVSLRFAGPTDPGAKQVVVKRGSAVTDAAGVARFVTKLPVVGAGQYRVEATFDGDGNLSPSTGSNTVGMVKGVGRIEFSPLQWVVSQCKTTVKLVRTSDGSEHSAVATLTGRPVGSGPGTGSGTVTERLPHAVLNDRRRFEGSGNALRVTFAGDDSMLPVEATLDPPPSGCD